MTKAEKISPKLSNATITAEEIKKELFWNLPFWDLWREKAKDQGSRATFFITLCVYKLYLMSVFIRDVTM